MEKLTKMPMKKQRKRLKTRRWRTKKMKENDLQSLTLKKRVSLRVSWK
jgi:hypothetical protein